jgi:alkylhydroperoxidase/carboxymuconolactone decarboxylase family protein YurZ
VGRLPGTGLSDGKCSGPLDARTRRLIKLGIAIGASFDSAARSHIRRALREDAISADELRHVALLAITTTGWSRGVAALDWIERVIEENAPKS